MRLWEAGAAPKLLPPIVAAIRASAREALGDEWCDAGWYSGPDNAKVAGMCMDSKSAPKQLNATLLLWVFSLWKAFECRAFAKRMNGNTEVGGDWCAGSSCQVLDDIPLAELEAAVGEKSAAALHELKEMIYPVHKGLHKDPSRCVWIPSVISAAHPGFVIATGR